MKSNTTSHDNGYKQTKVYYIGIGNCAINTI